MLVRYRPSSTCTLANLQSDINNIITGQVSTVLDLSSGADQVNSVIYGTYPTSVYTKVNVSTYTYSKVHSTESSYTHYFRLTYSASELTGFSIAQAYTSGSDTLVNSVSKTLTLSPYPYDNYYRNTIDILITDKCFMILNPGMNAYYGIFDIGHNGVSRTYNSSMLMMGQDFNDVINYGTPNAGGMIPYSYSFDTLSYATLTTNHDAINAIRKQTASNNAVVIENPVYAASTAAGNAGALVYGVYKLQTGLFSGVQTYKDSSNVYRLTINDYAILVD